MHVEYPHEPGMLFDCADCENGPCVCTEQMGGCVSIYCWQNGFEDDNPSADCPDGCTCLYCIPGA